MAFKNELHNLQTKVLVRNVIIGILCCFIFWQAILLITYPKRFNIDIPPDPRVTQTVKPGYKFPSTVHAFTAMIFQYLNTWDNEGGSVDYKDRRNILRAYMTPDFYDWAKDDYARKLQSGELKNRMRKVQIADGSFFKPEHVVVVDDGWHVTLTLDVVERVYGQIVKDVTIEYVFHVVKYNVDPTKNAYQLGINGLVKPPKLVKREK